MDQIEFKKPFNQLLKSPVFILVLILCVFDILLAFTTGSRHFIYRSQSHSDSVFDESHPLFQKLDPNLGYTFVPNFSPTSEEVKKFLLFDEYGSVSRSLDGYITYEFRAEENPLVVATFGNCSTDGNMFKGNWPWKLHLLLKEKNIPHVIYNGGVSGYNSFQEFVKISRDVDSFPKKVSWVVNFDGGGDVESNDSVTGFSNVHHFQMELMSSLTGEAPQTTYGFFPNLRHFVFNKIVQPLSTQKALYSLGLPSRDSALQYKRNIENIQAVLKGRGIRFLHLRQITDEEHSEKLYPSSIDLENQKSQLKKSNEFVAQGDLLFKELPYSIRMSDVLHGEEKLYYYPGDPNEEGQKKMAEYIYEFIKSNR